MLNDDNKVKWEVMSQLLNIICGILFNNNPLINNYQVKKKICGRISNVMQSVNETRSLIIIYYFKLYNYAWLIPIWLNVVECSTNSHTSPLHMLCGC